MSYVSTNIRYILITYLITTLTRIMNNPYEILGVPHTASEAEIKDAYRKGARKYHPDKHKTESEKARASAIFAKIADAYSTLNDPVKRYDWKLKNGERPTVNTARRPSRSAPTPNNVAMRNKRGTPPVSPSTSRVSNTPKRQSMYTSPNWRRNGRITVIENPFEPEPSLSSTDGSLRRPSMPSVPFGDENTSRTSTRSSDLQGEPPVRRSHRHSVDYIGSSRRPEPGRKSHKQKRRPSAPPPPPPNSFVERLALNLKWNKSKGNKSKENHVQREQRHRSVAQQE
jgi:curved DNA-binding protein CbpA